MSADERGAIRDRFARAVAAVRGYQG
jgi:hypothetical protein